MEIKTRRQYLKKLLINAFGAKCSICGYDNCLGALVFHHVNPKEKDFNIAKIASKKNLSYPDFSELSKCILLCANCHAEVHAGLHPDLEVQPPDLSDLLD